MQNWKILGVCGAQGALLYPLRRWLIGNIEPRGVFHTPNEEQWRLNFGEVPFVKSLDALKIDNPDMIVGSPSCGHSSVFSYSRKKTLGKPREDVCLNLFLSCVKKFTPRIFVMENLPKLLDLIPLPEWEANLPGYKFIVHSHSVSAFGNSQTSRKRLLLVGIRADSTKFEKYFSRIFSGRRERFLTCDISGMIRPELNYRETGDRKLSMYKYWDPNRTTLTVDEVHELWNGKFKQEFKWPMRTQKMKTLPGVYRNRNWAPPLTLRPSNRQFNPEGWPMGLEEFRVIMGFPKRFKVWFDESNPTYWLNKGRNALSKGAVYEIGLWLRSCLRSALDKRKKEKRKRKGFPKPFLKEKEINKEREK